MMELVDYKVHKDSKHTGGFAIWGTEDNIM